LNQLLAILDFHEAIALSDKGKDAPGGPRPQQLQISSGYSLGDLGHALHRRVKRKWRDKRFSMQ